MADFRLTFDKKLKPAVETWCKAYAGHVPFQPEALTEDKLYGQSRRDTNYCMYTFMVGDITLGVQDARGSCRSAT